MPLPAEVLKRYWGFDAFRPMQEDVVRSVLDGRDALALLPTGGGKSICYQVPALCMGKLCLVVSPLIALMTDQVEQLRARGIAARQITSGMKWAEIDNTLEAAAHGKLAFLFVSPERLATDVFMARLPRLPVGLLAVDEAHCISQWGYDFRPSYLRIAEVRAVLPHVPVLALTASATAQVAQDIMQRLGFKHEHLLRGSFARPELVLWVSRGEDRMGRLLRIMDKVPGSAIIYMRERKGTVRIAQFLKQHGIEASAYHAGLPAGERDRIQRAWTANTIRCVVATNAFGMGIDKPDVRCVVHLEPPPDLESYYQEAGRGGRDGRTAHAFLLTGPGDEERAMERLRSGFPTLAEVRRVYQAFADVHGIALGAGMHETYTVDLVALSKRAQLRPAIVSHALKTLELSGLLALSEGVRSPSRALIIATGETVYRMRIGDARLGPLIEALLRLHGGLFEEPSIVDESRLARMLEKPEAWVCDRLSELDSMGVLSYRPRSDSPTATLLAPRQDADRLTLEPQALRQREERARLRLEALLDFVRSTEHCRMAMVLSYFDEREPPDCGRCDVCVARTRYRMPAEESTVASEPLATYERSRLQERWARDEYGGAAAKEGA
ncbi:MAG: RecQ family ATP-dependent DNA helicase [Flavobacteriales bacterium]|nr:RecQ family ATP-dependent DNA helicase [Flavobacteriales bacterium]